MTSSARYRLRIELQSSYNNLWYLVEYDTFLIDSEAGGYAIHVTGNAMQYHNGMKFSTRDVDNDLYVGSCAIDHGTGNWYNACYCFLLTGSGNSNQWYGYGVLASRMMIQMY